MFILNKAFAGTFPLGCVGAVLHMHCDAVMLIYVMSEINQRLFVISVTQDRQSQTFSMLGLTYLC